MSIFLLIKEKLEPLGWQFESKELAKNLYIPIRCFYKLSNNYEVDISFCIGDFCVGLWDENLNIVQPKRSFESFFEAFDFAKLLINEYINIK